MKLNKFRSLFLLFLFTFFIGASISYADPKECTDSKKICVKSKNSYDYKFIDKENLDSRFVESDTQFCGCVDSYCKNRNYICIKNKENNLYYFINKSEFDDSYYYKSGYAICGCGDNISKVRAKEDNVNSSNDLINDESKPYAGKYITASELCDMEGVIKASQMVGYILFIIKIVAPLMLIIFGAVTLGKAVIANDDKAIKSSTTSLIKKCIAGVIIFFIPTVVNVVMSLVDGFDDTRSFECITSCLYSPSSCVIPDGYLFE